MTTPDIDPAVAAPTPGPAGRRSLVRAFFSRPTVILFVTLLGVIGLMCMLAPILTPNPNAAVNQPLLGPSAEYLMGTDNLGRDVFARVLHGGRVSILVGLSVALLCLTLGVFVGGLAGFYGGFADLVLTKVTEFFQAIPGLILALTAVAILGSSLSIIIIILALTMWPQVARIMRAESMKISELGYIESARAAGFSSFRIFCGDVIPNALPPVLVATTMTVGRAILIESALSFLGLGDADNPSWGALLNVAQPYMQTAWWMAFFPGLATFLVVLAANMLGDRLNDVLNPALSRVKA